MAFNTSVTVSLTISDSSNTTLFFAFGWSTVILAKGVECAVFVSASRMKMSLTVVMRSTRPLTLQTDAKTSLGMQSLMRSVTSSSLWPSFLAILRILAINLLMSSVSGLKANDLHFALHCLRFPSGSYSSSNISLISAHVAGTTIVSYHPRAALPSVCRNSTGQVAGR